jgi:hypothetical protein
LGLREKILPQRRRFRSFKVSRFRDSKYGDSLGAENARKICGEHSEKLLTAKDAKKSIESRVASKAVKIGIHDRGDRKSRRRSGERVIGPFQPE